MLTLGDFPQWFITSVGVLLGLVFGSFLNVVIYRCPREQSLVRPGSRCPNCGAPIKAYDNVPVLSWLVLKGRSRCCKTKISARYPLVELLSGLLSWAILSVCIFPLGASTPLHQALLLFGFYLALGLGLVAAAFIDLEHMLLPDALTLGGTVLGLLSSFFRPELSYKASLLGATLGFLMIYLPFDKGYRWLRGRPGMALGDAKLVMLAGAWFGIPGALFSLLAGALQGTLFALTMILTRHQIEEPEAVKNERREMLQMLEEAPPEEREALRAELEKDPIFAAPSSGFGQARLAFGPFLALGCLEYLLFGPWLIEQGLGLSV